MSADGDLLQDTDLAREPVKEPAKRWRNWYRAIKWHRNTRLGLLKPGEIYFGLYIYPSKEVAEQRHQDNVARGFLPCGVPSNAARGYSEYLGAFPEGERP